MYKYVLCFPLDSDNPCCVQQQENIWLFGCGGLCFKLTHETDVVWLDGKKHTLLWLVVTREFQEVDSLKMSETSHYPWEVVPSPSESLWPTFPPSYMYADAGPGRFAFHLASCHPLSLTLYPQTWQEKLPFHTCTPKLPRSELQKLRKDQIVQSYHYQ